MPIDPSEDTVDYAPSTIQAAQVRPVSERAKVDLAARSHQGNVRPRNEDIYFVCRLLRSLQTVHTNMPSGAIPDVSATADEACRKLVELALDHGGKDNVTVVLARYSFIRDP